MLKLLPLTALILAIASIGLLQGGRTAEAGNNILWRDCLDGYQCGTIRVPLDYSRPGNGNIEIALVRVPALDQQNKVGSLLVNFGGPGGPGVEGVLFSVDQFPFEIRERFDIIGFDPRGVGQSTQIDCIDDFEHFFADWTPDTPAELDLAIEEARRFGADCQRRSPQVIQYVNSEAAARDMDRIREELGEEKLTYLGFSYGTFLGATYAEFFPENVRALLLDAGMNPAALPEEDVIQQATGFEVALDSFFAVCASDPDCPFKAPDLEAAFDEIVARAEEEPLGGWNYPIIADYIINATSIALYDREYSWLLLAEAMRQAYEDNSGVGFGALLDRGQPVDDDGEVDFTNPYEAFIAIACVDFWSFRGEQHFRQTLADAKVTAPHFGELFSYNALPCVFWPGAERRIPRVYTASGAAPILVIGGLRDPATPYEWSVALADGLESGVLLTYDGDGHTSLGFSTCVDAYALAYLIDLTVPPAGITCPNEYGDTFPATSTDAGFVPPVEAAPVVPAAPAPPPTGTITAPDTGAGADQRSAMAAILAGFALAVTAGAGLALGVSSTRRD